MNPREARPADAPAIARVHVESWRTSYRGLVPDAYLDGLRIDERAAWWERVLVADQSDQFAYVAENEMGHIVGFASGGPQRSAIPGYAGELYAIYLLHTQQRRGIGRCLLRVVAARLAREHLCAMLLWVFAENHAARRFYARLGGQVIASGQFERGGVPLEEVAYGWPDVTMLLDQEG